VSLDITTVTPSGGNVFMSVSVAPSVLIFTVPLTGSGSPGLTEMSIYSVEFPVGDSFARG
jgi:hypothetical protein